MSKYSTAVVRELPSFTGISIGLALAVMYFLSVLLAGKFELPSMLSFGAPRFRIVKVKQQWGTLKRNQSVTKGPLKIGGIQYASGLGTHSKSSILLNVYAKSKRFSGKCGVNDQVVKGGSIRCSIVINNREVFSSPIIRFDNPAVSFSIPTENTEYIELKVSDADDGSRYDHANWVDLKLE